MEDGYKRKFNEGMKVQTLSTGEGWFTIVKVIEPKDNFSTVIYELSNGKFVQEMDIVDAI